jgi:hypothetical protein
MWLKGENRFGKPMPSLFHTSHPGLCEVLRRDKKWAQVSANLYGGNRGKSVKSLNNSAKASGGWGDGSGGKSLPGEAGYGGHFRAVQGFRYLGERK